jgi:DNA-binding GntR family transcriptional regulator
MARGRVVKKKEAAARPKARSARAQKSADAETSRAQWVYKSLRTAIHEGKYARGERIREEEVARSLGVSRTPVREALSLLQAAGLLEISAGGLVVAQLTRSQVIELYAMREILEGAAASFAAQHASPTEIATLRQLCRIFERSLDDPRKLALINRELHNAIYEASHNRYMMRTLHELHDALALMPGTTFTIKGRPMVVAQEHAQIVDAIEKRDAAAAERAARAHIRGAQEARLEMLFDFPQLAHVSRAG